VMTDLAAIVANDPNLAGHANQQLGTFAVCVIATDVPGHRRYRKYAPDIKRYMPPCLVNAEDSVLV
jgi:hypothetical protein